MGATFRRTVPLLGALLVLLAFGAPQASAASLTLNASDTNPTVGNPVTYTVSMVSDCGAASYTFTIDGVTKPSQASSSYTATFTTTGNHTVSVLVTLVPCAEPNPTTSTTVTVSDAPGGTISFSNDPPRPGVAGTLSLVHSGGRAPYSGYRWKINGIADPAGNDRRSYPKTFSTAGSYIVEVTFTDTGDASINEPPHQGRATRTFTVEEPPAPVPGQPVPPPAPAPEPCQSSLSFQLSDLTTEGCFARIPGSSPEQWVTTDRVRLNGVAFADTGQRFVVTMPNPNDRGGHIKTDNGAIELDRFIPFSGNVDWSLPEGKAGETKTLREVAVPAFAQLFKLRIAGSIAIKIGRTAAGKGFVSFPLNVELPPAFTAGPTKFSGGVSGTASLVVDDTGINYEGLKVAVSDVWVGRLKVVSACFSFVSANGGGTPCDPLTLRGKPYLTCADGVGTNRWDGNAILELPTPSQTKLGAFGGLAEGRVSKLGGYVDGLGTAVPIVPGIFLDRVGVGLCLSPPPFKLRGDVGINALGGALAVGGRFLYTDATDSAPWRLEVGGDVSFRQIELGDASVGFNGWGDVDFNVNAGMNLLDVAQITGNLYGWIEPRNSTFTLGGSVQGCITGLGCQNASGLVSNVGVAGCLDLGTITIDVPGNARQGAFGFGSVSFTTSKRTYSLKGGFGYRYGGSVDLLGNSCNFAPYAAARTARAAGAGLTERVARGTRAVSFRVAGTNGPPKIVVRGPGGTTITSPATGTGVQRKDRFALAENPSDGTTSVLLVEPAAGTWTVTAAPGAASKPKRISRSSFEAPPVLFGQARRRGRDRQVAVQYAVPEGATVRVLERGKGISRTLARSVRGKRCRGTRALPDGRVMKCAVLRFEPSRGPGGTRRVEALVTRGGIPLARQTVATFQAPKPGKPSRPGTLSARRVNGGIVVTLPRVTGAARLTASATLADGRKLGFDLAASCRALRIPGVAADDSAAIKVAGVRYDLVVGAYRRIALAANKRTAGPQKKKLPKRSCS